MITTTTSPQTFSVEARRSTRPGVLALAEQLAAEYAGACAPGTVIAEVVRAREQLLALGVRNGILDATETAARLRIRQRLTPSGRSSVTLAAEVPSG